MKQSFILIIFTIIFLISCSKNDTIVNTGIPGNIMGKIELQDENNALIGNNAGATINLKGTNYFCVSDSIGNWTLTNVPPGIYDVIFSKPGYDTLMFFGYSFVGNGTDILSAQILMVNKNTDGNIGLDVVDYNSWVLKQTRPEIISNLTIASNFQSDTTQGEVFSYLELSLNCDKYIPTTIFLANYSNLSNYSYQINISNQYAYYDSVSKILKLKPYKSFFSRYKSGDIVYIKIYPGYGSYTQDLRNNYIQWIDIGQSSVEGSFIVP